MTMTEAFDRAYGAASRPAELVRLPALAPYAGPVSVPVRDRDQRPRELVGRDQDLAVIGAFVDRLAGHGDVLLLSGEPGIGKSALLDAAQELAATAQIRALRAAGAEFEDVSYFALNQLLLPLRDDLGRLDPPQRDALNVALGFRDGPACGRLVVSNAVLALLCQAAASRPLLLIVDDLHWVDRASAMVLGFIARRLPASRVGLIAAQRTGAARIPALDLPGYQVRPLDELASARLVTAHFPGLVSRVRQRIVAEARGNALALLELPAGLSARQRCAQAPMPAALPLSDRVRALLSARVSALPATAGYLLLLAVLTATGDLDLVRAAAAGQCDIDELAAAEQAGLVHVDRGARRVVLSHPLIRAAVLELAAGGDQRRAHLALAAQLSGQPERRAWHLAGSAADQDGGAVRLLDQRHSLGDANRARQLRAAAYLAASVTGDLNAAESLLADARRACPGPQPSVDAALADAFVLLHADGDVAAAQRLLRQGLQAEANAGLASVGQASVEQASLLLVTLGRLSGRAEPVAVPGGLDVAVESLAYLDDPAQVVRIASASVLVDALSDCRLALRRAARVSPAGLLSTAAMQASILLALEAYQTGQWDEAWLLAKTAADRCAGQGYQLLYQQAQTVLALVAACRGEAETAQQLADEIARWAAPRGIAALLAGAQYAYALTALAQSDFQTVYQQAAKISPAGVIAPGEPFAGWALLDLIEAALRTDRRAEALAHVQAVRQAGIATVSPRMALLSAAATAMTAPDDAAPALFDLALAVEDAGRWSFDQARVRLLYGERLRRMRAVTAARVQLGAALDEFRRLGAPTWAERAATALRATGQARQRVDKYAYQVLTAQELEIARLASTGMTNKQIADRLYMSHRTVGSHLYQIFPKLGVTSRAALSSALPREEG